MGRSQVPGSRVSYGAASAGGALGMVIVAVLINMDVGKINLLGPIENAPFVSKLEEVAQKATVVKQAPSTAILAGGPTEAETTAK